MTEETPQEELANEPTEPVIESNLEEKAEKPKEQKKPDNRYSKRVEELNTKFREEQREKETLAARVAELEEQSKIKEEPDPDSYVDDGKLREDQNKWKSQETARIKQEARQELQQENARKAQQEKANKVLTNYGKKRLEGDGKYEGWYESEKKVGDALQSHGEHAAEVRDSILESKNSDAIIDHFGNNPDKLQDIAFLSPREQAKAIWALDKELEGKPAKITSAPDPVRSGTKSAQVPANPANETTAEYIKRKNFG